MCCLYLDLREMSSWSLVKKKTFFSHPWSQTSHILPWTLGWACLSESLPWALFIRILFPWSFYEFAVRVFSCTDISPSKKTPKPQTKYKPRKWLPQVSSGWTSIASVPTMMLNRGCVFSGCSAQVTRCSGLRYPLPTNDVSILTPRTLWMRSYLERAYLQM